MGSDERYIELREVIEMNRVTHFDITSKHPEKTAGFYSQIFGWKFQKWDGPMEYWMITTGKNGNGINGGLAKKGGSEMPSKTINVKDLDESISHIESHGGKILSKKMPIPGVGWFSAFRDPEGNKFGLMQTDKKAN